MATLNYKAEAILRAHYKKHYQQNAYSQAWRNLPEIPSTEEIKPTTNIEGSIDDEKAEKWDDYQRDPLYDPKLPQNIIDGPWPSREAYVGAHYQMLREDAIASLRKSVAEVYHSPTMNDDHDTCIYTHVCFPYSCNVTH